MSSDVLKCSTCNIVINELLCFIQNKADVMTEDSIVRLCVSSFSPEQVTIAKNLLFCSVPATVNRNIKRKEGRKDGKSGKICRELEDIISLLKCTNPEDTPIFVARELQRLPPMTFDHVDVSRLLKDIIILQKEVSEIKDSYVTNEQLTKLETKMAVSFQYVPESNFVNTKRGLSNKNLNSDYDSEPIRIINVSPSHSKEINNSSTTAAMHGKTYPSEPAMAPNVSQTDTECASQRTYADVCLTTVEATLNGIKKNMDHSFEKQTSEKWTVVKEKRRNDRFIGQKGKADPKIGCNFRAANIKIPFYIYNVDINCEVTDIKKYIKCNTEIEVEPEKVNMRLKKDYGAYKFYIPKDKLHIFMDKNLWPSGVCFRRFINFHKQHYDDNSVTSEPPKNGAVKNNS